MIAVRKHDEREGAPPAGHANMSIERYVRVGKWPRGASPEVGERRNIDAARDVRRIRRIVDHILGQRCRVGERRRAVDEGIELHVTGDGRVFQTCHSAPAVSASQTTQKQKSYSSRYRRYDNESSEVTAAKATAEKNSIIAAIIDMKSQSYLGLSSNCAASCVGLRHRDRQRYGPSHPNIHYRPEPDAGGPSWLAFLGHTKDS